MKFSKRRKKYLRKRISALRNRGLSNKQIAVKLGISESSLYRLAGKTSVSDDGEAQFFPEGSAPASPVTKAIAVKLLGFGLGLREVGWLFGRSPSTVGRWKRDFSDHENPTI